VFFPSIVFIIYTTTAEVQQQRYRLKIIIYIYIYIITTVKIENRRINDHQYIKYQTIYAFHFLSRLTYRYNTDLMQLIKCYYDDNIISNACRLQIVVSYFKFAVASGGEWLGVGGSCPRLSQSIESRGDGLVRKTYYTLRPHKSYTIFTNKMENGKYCGFS